MIIVKEQGFVSAVVYIRNNEKNGSWFSKDAG